jgi:hypothetical protein
VVIRTPDARLMLGNVFNFCSLSVIIFSDNGFADGDAPCLTKAIEVSSLLYAITTLLQN